jgi:hypothetical protein
MTKLLMTIFLGSIMFSGVTFAETQLEKIITKKDVNQSTQKKSRRKKVEMCQECGKPEPQCECEGEEHGVEEEKNDMKEDS